MKNKGLETEVKGMDLKDIKEGTKVKVREDLVVGKRYGGITLLPAMIKHAGEETTVNQIEDGYYMLACEDEGFYYSLSMLEKI